jgi:hypothetical protein
MSNPSEKRRHGTIPQLSPDRDDGVKAMSTAIRAMAWPRNSKMGDGLTRRPSHFVAKRE